MILLSLPIALQAFLAIFAVFAGGFVLGRDTRRQEKKQQEDMEVKVLFFRGKSFFITPALENLLHYGICVDIDNTLGEIERYYYMPFFFHRRPDASFEILDYAELPEQARQTFDEISKTL